MSQETLKQCAAHAALDYIDKHHEDKLVLGVGTGSTVKYFIEGLANLKSRIKTTVASSIETERLLREQGIPITDYHEATKIDNAIETDVYVDGADEIDGNGHMIKGGGGALTREKTLGYTSGTFICIADKSKAVRQLGTFPLPIEVLEKHRQSVEEAIQAMGGNPVLRENFTTDNDNVIIDVAGLTIGYPMDMEEQIECIPGVICVGIFAKWPADRAYIGVSDTECEDYVWLQTIRLGAGGARAVYGRDRPPGGVGARLYPGDGQIAKIWYSDD